MEINLDNINPEDIEFEEEDETWNTFLDNSSKPMSLEELMSIYKQLGINIDDYPKLKELVLAKQEEAKTKKNNKRKK